MRHEHRILGCAFVCTCIAFIVALAGHLTADDALLLDRGRFSSQLYLYNGWMPDAFAMMSAEMGDMVPGMGGMKM